jgi:hypothetical protein
VTSKSGHWKSLVKGVLDLPLKSHIWDGGYGICV